MKKKLNLDKTIIMAVILNLVQLGTIVGIIVYFYIFNHGDVVKTEFYSWYILFVIFILMVMLNCFLTIRDIQSLRHSDLHYNMIKNTLEELQSLNTTLRAQRHDFMNHLQVVYGLMEMEDYKEATEYIETVYNDIQKVNQVLRTANPAVNALLQAKVLFAEKRGITTKLKITTQLKDLKVPAWEFCRILGNIIDNAIYALQEKDGFRLIEVELFEDLKNYGFRIRNNGGKIPENLISKIFEVGITTKGDKGDGMGLAIVKELIEEYNGQISVKSDDEYTFFEGSVIR
ncbi:MAG: Spo0B domain-containing protein [Clostridiaceae bacterium]|nr:Spo0B domain-containing protein [Clostridiaceae bacterium]